MSKNVPILFADIDGVLNTKECGSYFKYVANDQARVEWLFKQHEDWSEEHYALMAKYYLYPQKLFLLWSLFESIPNIECYIHSSWRRFYDGHEIVQMFNLSTNSPKIDFNKYVKDTVKQWKFSSQICHDVSAHVRDMSGVETWDHESDETAIVPYVIIDDAPSRFPFKDQIERLVVTDENVGLTFERCDAVRALFKMQGVEVLEDRTEDIADGAM